jgi:hypothetical protein
MKFDQGDVVEYQGKKARVVTGWKSMHGSPKYKIKMAEGDLIGTEIDVLESKISKVEGVSGIFGWIIDTPSKKTKFGIDHDERCPICSCKWIVTKFNKQIWYDCKRCKKSKEQILKDLSLD